MQYIENPKGIRNFTSYMTISPGQSYVSGNGGATWYDVYDSAYPGGGNLSIKALAGDPLTWDSTSLVEIWNFILAQLLRILASFGW